MIQFRGVLSLLCTGMAKFIQDTGIFEADYRRIHAISRRLTKTGPPRLQVCCVNIIVECTL